MLTGRQLDTAAANLLRSAELARVLAAFDAARLPVWLLKDHSMLATAVDNIVGQHSNLWEVNTERVYHEEKEAARC